MATPTSETPWAFAPVSGNAAIDGLLEGLKYTTKTLTYSFPGGGSNWSTDPNLGYGPSSGDREPWAPTFEALSSSDRQAVRDALASWSAVSGLKFSQSADNATTVGDLRLAYTHIAQTANSQAWAYTPGSGPTAGDVWFNTDGTSYTQQWSKGSYEYMTVLHEIGHAIGLKHPFDSGHGTPTLSPALDTRAFTVMSYAAKVGDDDTYFSVEPTTPMVLDIAAIQYLYGANAAHNAGATTYTFAQTGAYHETIWDGGGIDTIVYQSSIGGRIDLNAGTSSGSSLGAPLNVLDAFGQTLYQQQFNIYIAKGTVIENAIGGSGSDTLIGNASANRLDGGADWDNMRGGNGNDTYVVDSGADIVLEFSTQSSQIDTVRSSVSWVLDANLETLVLTGVAEIDGFGNALANTLSGNAGVNHLYGEAGNDRLNGYAGSDTLTGGSGNDVYTVDTVGDTIVETSTLAGEIDTVWSSVSWVLGANLEKLVLTGAAVANAAGNALANTITGNAATNRLNGGAGNDTLFGRAGNDTLFGGGGFDTFRFDSTLSTATNVDRLPDFRSIDDRIQLDDAVFAGIGATGALAAAALRFGSAAADGSDRVIYHAATGRLSYDRDGTGAASAVLFATVLANTTLALSDFYVV